MIKKEKNWTVFFIYLTTFITAIGYAFVIYINSSFLGKFIDEKYISSLYIIGSIFTLIILSNISHILKKIGHYKMMLGIITLEALSLLGAGFIDFTINNDGNTKEITTLYVPILVISSFVIFSVTATLLRFSLDLYLEKYSKDEDTGGTRGLFLTTINVAIAISPFIVGLLLTNSNYWKIYLLAGIIFIPAIIISAIKLKKVPDVQYHNVPFTVGFKKLWKNKDLHSIFMSNFLLEFFYSWMVIYTPIYLHQNMNFSWNDIGIMFSIMLTSFIILQIPLGKIADKYLGEKEILTAGFVIAGISTMYLSFIETADFITWTALLFTTRVGAAAIEIMNETYLFKKVSPKDSDIIGFFRNASPLAYIIAPVLAIILLNFIDLKNIFIVLGLIMLCGAKYSLSIKDTL
ncbi:MAG: MFS transporter [bacterium]